MTSIVSIVTVFMATFMLVFIYLTYADEEWTYAEEESALVEADRPAAPATSTDR